MSAELEWELAAFNSVADMVVEKSSRTYPQFINGEAYAVCLRAIPATQKANAEQIAHILGQIGTVVKTISTKTGKLIKARGKKALLADNSFAARIVNSRLKKAGQPMIWGDSLTEAARKLIARRKSSVAFIRSGWVWAARKIGKSVGAKFDKGATDRVRGVPKGDAIPAQGGLAVLSGDVSATIINTSLLAVGKYSHGNPMPIAEAGLQRALNETSVDMLDHLADKLKPVFNEHSAK